MRRGRAILLFAAAAALLAIPLNVRAGHCPPSPGMPDEWCHTTPPPGRTPAPTARPTPRPTPRPTAAPARTAAATRQPVFVPNVSQTAAPIGAPAQTPIEVSPAATAEVTVPGPAFNTLPSAPIDTVQNSASLTTWIFGFIAGFLIGALVGRASWGVSRRRRRQQIFG